jgi:hypothetical protein
MTSILVTGGRAYTNEAVVADALESVIRDKDNSIVIHGGAPGADTLAMRWCYMHGVHAAAVPALWDIYIYGAGPRRNSAMLLLNPDVVLVFPGGNGTADMVAKAKMVGLPIKRFS